MLVVRDDGAGLDYEAIRRRGVQRGWIAADRPATRQELAQLIFRPGFSTREQSSEVSGRGVGMDVVAATLEHVRGWVEVESEPGQGTSVHLAIPLRSAIEHVMAFRAGNQLFALPMSFVIRATGPGADNDQDAGRTRGSESAPAVRFADLFSDVSGDRSAAIHKLTIGNAAPSPSRTAPGAAAADDRSTPRGQRLSLLVDEILGPEEVVVRPMPALLAGQALFSAVTLSGTGDIVLLIDARRLLDMASGARGLAAETGVKW
jgi:chemotaxis protein histidine kinase CheA